MAPGQEDHWEGNQRDWENWEKEGLKNEEAESHSPVSEAAEAPPAPEAPAAPAAPVRDALWWKNPVFNYTGLHEKVLYMIRTRVVQ